MSLNRLVTCSLLLVVALLTACGDDSGGGNNNGGSASNIPANAIQISVIYAPESEQYMPEIMRRFNEAYQQGNNPLTGQPLAEGERPIYITGEPPQGGLSSGGVTQAIVNAVIAPNNANVLRPTLFAPSVSHWLSIANLNSGRPLFDLAEAEPTAISPVVIAIWESRLNAIKETLGTENIGWEELLMVLNSPNGWQDFGLPDARRAVYYGHADPRNSSTALSTLIAEFYACSRQVGYTDQRMQLEWVEDESVQACVREIELLVKHYARRTEDFLDDIARGPDYLDFVAVEETDMICMNTGGEQDGQPCTKPTERLVALYPKEGTFWHEHPIAVVNAEWVTEAQRQAGEVFIDFMLLEPQQELIMSYGFRPANLNVELAYPFVEENGVTPDTSTINPIAVPASEVLTALQANWSLVRKQADVIMLFDISGSMNDENKLEQAKIAAEAFLDNIEGNNRVGLYLFSDEVEERVPLDRFETNEVQMRSHIKGLRAEGGTELYFAIQAAVERLNQVPEDDRIRAVVVLSDGEDTGDRGVTLQNTLNAIEASQNSANPVIVIPVAYGANADIGTLVSIANASATEIASGDPENIAGVLEILSAFF